MTSHNFITNTDIMIVNDAYVKNGSDGLEELCSTILSKNNINKLHNIDGSTMLMQLLTFGSHADNIIKILITDYFADINITDKKNYSILMWATRRRNVDLVKFLIIQGADTDIKDKYGKSFLSYFSGETLDEIKNLIYCNVKPAKRN